MVMEMEIGWPLLHAWERVPGLALTLLLILVGWWEDFESVLKSHALGLPGMSMDGLMDCTYFLLDFDVRYSTRTTTPLTISIAGPAYCRWVFTASADVSDSEFYCTYVSLILLWKKMENGTSCGKMDVYIFEGKR
jgi:hypothetical protein